jgi:hypothetical protein
MYVYRHKRKDSLQFCKLFGAANQKYSTLGTATDASCNDGIYYTDTYTYYDSLFSCLTYLTETHKNEVTVDMEEASS